MASQTVDSLLLQTQVDDAGLTQQFNKQIQEVNRLTDQVNRASAAMRPITITADTRALSVAEQSVSDFFAGFKGAQVQDVVGLLEAMNAELEATGQTDFTGKLIAQLTTIQGEFVATSTEAKELQAIIDTLGQSKLPSAAAGGGSGPPPPPPSDQFAAFRREAAATNVIVSELTATMAKGNAGNLAWAQGSARLTQQQAVENAELAESARRATQYAEAGRQANLSPFARGLEEIRLTSIGTRGELVAGTAALETHALGARRATTAIAQLAATSLGAEGPVARLAESALLFGGGEIAIVGVAAAVLAVAQAYNFLNTEQREADERNQRLLVGLRAEVEQLTAAETARRGLAAAIDAEAKAREGLAAKIAGPAAAVFKIVTDPLATGVGIGTEIKRRQEEGVTKSLEEQRQAQKDLFDAEIANLTQSLSLHIATSAQRQRAIDLVQALLGQEGALLATDEQKIANAKLLNSLQQAIGDRALEAARLAATTQGIQAEHALKQQAITADEADVRAQFAQEAVIRQASLQGELAAREQFYAALKALRIAAARDDETAISQRITAIQGQSPTKDPAVQTARDAEIAGLRSQIALREQVLRAQLQQLANEQRLAQLTPLERVGALSAPQRLEETFQLRTVGVEELKAELQTEIAAAIKAMSDDAKQIDFEKAAASAKTMDNVLVGVTMKLTDIGNANITKPIDEAVTATEKWDKALTKVGQAASALDSIRQTISGTGRDAGDAVGNVVDLGHAISDIGKDIKNGDAFAVLADVVSGVKSIGNLLGFGKSDTEKMLEQAQKENTAALHRATVAFEAAKGAGGVAEQQAQVQRGLFNPAAQAAIAAGDTTALRQAVAAAGGSLEDLRAIAKTYGVTLVRDHKLIEGATDALVKSMELAAKSLTTLSTDPGAVRSRLAAEDSLKIGGRSDDPQVASVQREREVILQGVNLSAQEEARIRALDLETAKGRAEFLKWEQDFARRAETPGGISATELGAFDNVDALILALGSGADAVNAFNDSIHAVTDQTANIPRSFKQFQLTTGAEVAGLGPNAPQGPETPRLRGTDVVIPLPPGVERGSDGASLPDLISVLKSADLPTLAQAIKAAKEKPAVISGNTVHQTFAANVGDIREFARLVAIAMRELDTADHSSSSSSPWDVG